MFKAIFFDLDETLVDADYCHTQASNQAFKKFGLDYQQAKKLDPKFDSQGLRIIDVLKQRKNALKISEKALPLKQLYQARQKIFLSYVAKKAFLFPGARQAIIHARKHSQIVSITSSGTRKYINLCLKKFNLTKYIDFIVAEQDVKKGKPHPEIYLKAFSLLPKNLKIKKTECLVIEDSINGVKAAKAAHLPVLFIPSPYTKSTINADYRLKSLKELNLYNL